MSVIEHNFGAEERKMARRFTKLLTLGALHEANVRTNPLPYLERASERIFQLEKTLFEAVQASKTASGAPSTRETVEIETAEYQALLNCRMILEKALAELGVEEETIAADCDMA